MSEGNVDILRRGNAAFNRGDLDGLVNCFAEDAELVDRARAPDQPQVITGRSAIREVTELWTSEFDEFRQEIEEYSEVGDAVVCAARWQGVGKASGAPTEIRQFDAYEFLDGKVVRATLGCRTREEALEAVAQRNASS